MVGSSVSAKPLWRDFDAMARRFDALALREKRKKRGFHLLPKLIIIERPESLEYRLINIHTKIFLQDTFQSHGFWNLEWRDYNC